MLGWRCWTKIIHHVRQRVNGSGPLSRPSALMSGAIQLALPLLSGGPRLSKQRLTRSKTPKYPVPPMPVGLGCLRVSITGTFCHSHIDTGQCGRAAWERARRWESMSPRINSLLIQDNGAQGLPRPWTDGAGAPVEGWNSLERVLEMADVGKLRLLISRVNGRWGKAITSRSNTIGGELACVAAGMYLGVFYYSRCNGDFCINFDRDQWHDSESWQSDAIGTCMILYGYAQCECTIIQKDKNKNDTNAKCNKIYSLNIQQKIISCSTSCWYLVFMRKLIWVQYTEKSNVREFCTNLQKNKLSNDKNIQKHF